MKVIPVKPEQKDKFHLMKPENLFTSANWCAGYNERLIRFFITDDQENPIGGFVAYEGGRANLKTLITPPFAPHIGLFVEDAKNNPAKRNTFRKEVIEAIALFLKSSKYIYYKLDFSPDWIDMQPMIWQKIETCVRYTYRIDLGQTIEHITGNLDSSKRNKINKASRDGFDVSHEANPIEAFDLIKKNLEANKLHVHDGVMNHVLNLASDATLGQYSGTRAAGKNLSVNVCLYDDDIAYHLLSAVDRSHGVGNAGTLSLYHSIMLAKSQNKRIFDFEGSGVPEIEEYFRSFGGALVPYFSVVGGRWPWRWIMRWRNKN